MPDPLVMAKAAALAAFVTALATWLLARLSRPLGGALGTGLGILAGAWALGLAPYVPPRDALERLLLLLVSGAILAECVAPFRWGWLMRLAVAAGAVPVLVHGSSYVADLSGPGTREWSPGLAAGLFAGLAAALFLSWTALDRLARRSPTSAPLALAGTAAGAGITIMLSGYAAGGQLGVPLAAAAAAGGVLVLVGGRHSSGGAGAETAASLGVILTALFGLLVVGRLFAGLTTANAALLLAAPLAAWIPELWPLVRLGGKTRTGLRMALAATPVVVALVLAQQKFAADSAGPAASAGTGEASLNDYLGY